MKKKVIRDIIIILIVAFILAYYNHQIAIRDRKIISPIPVMSPNVVFAENRDIRPSYDLNKQERFITYIKKLAGRDANTLVTIASCEGLYHKTQINTANKNKSEDRGPLQINSVHYQRIPGNTVAEKKEWLMIPENNAMFGYVLFLEQGVSPWLSSRSCWNK